MPNQFAPENLLKIRRLECPIPSPDGRYIIFSCKTSSADSNEVAVDLFVLIHRPKQKNRSVDEWVMRQLTNTPGFENKCPVWVRRDVVAFLSNRRSDRFHIYIQSVRCGEPFQLTNFPIDISDLSVSANGDALAFTAEVFAGTDMQETARRCAIQQHRLDSALEFNKLFVRHWDSYSDGRHRHLFLLPLRSRTRDAQRPWCQYCSGDRSFLDSKIQKDNQHVASVDETYALDSGSSTSSLSSESSSLHISPTRSGHLHSHLHEHPQPSTSLTPGTVPQRGNASLDITIPCPACQSSGQSVAPGTPASKVFCSLSEGATTALHPRSSGRAHDEDNRTAVTQFCAPILSSSLSASNNNCNDDSLEEDFPPVEVAGAPADLMWSETKHCFTLFGSRDEMSFAPDGHELAYTAHVGHDEAWNLNWHVYIVRWSAGADSGNGNEGAGEGSLQSPSSAPVLDVVPIPASTTLPGTSAPVHGAPSPHLPLLTVMSKISPVDPMLLPPSEYYSKLVHSSGVHLSMLGEMGVLGIGHGGQRPPLSAEPDQSQSDIELVHQRSVTHCLTHESLGCDTKPVYSPDGRYLAYRSTLRPGHEADRMRITIYNRSTAVSTIIANDWDRSVESLVWSSDSTHLFITAECEGRLKVYLLHVADGIRDPSIMPTPLIVDHCNKEIVVLPRVHRTAQAGMHGSDSSDGSGHTGLMGSSSSTNLMDATSSLVARDSQDEGREQSPGCLEDIVFSVNSMTCPTEIHMCTIDLNSKVVVQRRALTALNTPWIHRFHFPQPKEVWFTGADGDRVHGWYLPPTPLDPTKSYPVAFLIHGGPQSAWLDEWIDRWSPIMFSSAGYGVIMINFHGSTGYGQEFTDSVSMDWGGKPFRDLQLGLDHCLQQFPYLDRDRVGAVGASYGGYMINWINGHNDEGRFHCLVNHDGVFDTKADYYTTEELWFPEWDFGHAPFENPSIYEQFSPQEFVAKWKTPTLVIHGGRDYRVSPSQGISTFTALQRKGVPSKLILFPDEGHWVLKPHNSVKWFDSVLSWLNRYLAKPKSSPE